MRNRNAIALLIAGIMAAAGIAMNLGSVAAGPLGIAYRNYLPLVAVQPTDTPQPTATPTATPTEAQPTISLVSLTSPVSAGDYATLVIHFAPGAGCFLSYVTPHGTQS